MAGRGRPPKKEKQIKEVVESPPNLEVITDSVESEVAVVEKKPTGDKYSMVNLYTASLTLEQLTDLYATIFKFLNSKNIIQLSDTDLNRLDIKSTDVDKRNLYMANLFMQKLSDIGMFTMSKDEYNQLPLILKNSLKI